MVRRYWIEQDDITELWDVIRGGTESPVFYNIQEEEQAKQVIALLEGRDTLAAENAKLRQRIATLEDDLEAAAQEQRLKLEERDQLRERVAELEQTNTNNVAIHEQQLNDLRTDIGKLADEWERDKAKAFEAMRTASGSMATAYQFTASAFEKCANELRKLEASNGRD